MKLLEREISCQLEQVEGYLQNYSTIGLLLLDSDLRVLDCNRGFLRMFRLRKKPLGYLASEFIQHDEIDLKEKGKHQAPCNFRSGVSGILHCYSLPVQSGYLLFCERILLTESRAMEVMGSTTNELFTLQREAIKKNRLLEKLRQELDERVDALEQALTQVRQLEGIIPICMYCKKIRDDQQSWHQLEQYISDHTEARFSHGLCPECMGEELAKLGQQVLEDS